MSFRSFFAVICLGLFGPLVVVGCASTPQPPSATEVAAIEARAKSRWASLIKGDLVAAYALLSPASRSATTISAFVTQNAKGPNIWRGVGETKAQCGVDTCNVSVTLEYDLHADVKGLKREIKETWIRDEGQWWLVYTQR